MATHHGKDGVVKVGANTVTEMKKFTIRTQGDVAEDTAMGDTWKTFLAGQKSWTAEFEVNWDELDTNGQETMIEGASVTLNMYPEGADTGDKYYTGSAIITEVGIDTPINGVVMRTMKAQGNGSLTLSTA